MQRSSIMKIIPKIITMVMIVPLHTQTVTVYLENVTESGNPLGGTLSVFSADGTQAIEENIPSGDFVFLNNNTEYQFRTDQQFLSNRQHHDWNNQEGDYFLLYNDNISGNTEEWAWFIQTHDVAISLNSNVPNVENWLELKDPWWVEDPEMNSQPDDYRTFSEMGIAGQHQVFYNEDAESNKPYYSLRAPELVAGPSGIYEFDSWNISGASVEPDPDHPSDIHYKALVFNSSSVSINANYTQVSDLTGTYIIPEAIELTIPQGVTMACQPNFQLKVAGKLRAGVLLIIPLA